MQGVSYSLRSEFKALSNIEVHMKQRKVSLASLVHNMGVLCLLVLISSCSDSRVSGSSLPTVTPATPVALVLPENAAMVEPTGGTLNLMVEGQEISVLIPEGAVSEDVQISMTTLSSEALAAALPGVEAAPVVAFNLQPAGTTFDQPIEFSMTAPASEAGGIEFLVGVLESNGVVEALDIKQTVDGAETNLTFSVSHFSNAIAFPSGVNISAALEDENGEPATNFPVTENFGVFSRKVRYRVEQQPGGSMFEIDLLLQRELNEETNSGVLASSIAERGTETKLVFADVLEANLESIERNARFTSGNMDVTSVTREDVIPFYCARAGDFAVDAVLVGDVRVASLSLTELSLTTGSLPFNNTITVQGSCVAGAPPILPSGPADPDPILNPTPDPILNPTPDPDPTPVVEPMPDPDSPVDTPDAPVPTPLEMTAGILGDISFVDDPFDIFLTSSSLVANRSYRIVTEEVTGAINTTFSQDSFIFMGNPGQSGTAEIKPGTVTCLLAPNDFTVTWNLEVTDTNGPDPVIFPQSVMLNGRCVTLPQAVDDAAQTTVGTPIDIDFLANDKNVGPQDSISTLSSSGEVSNPKLGTVTFEDAVINGDTKLVFRYVPNEFAVGVDSFSYFIERSEFFESSGTVTVTISPQEITPFDECGLFGTSNCQSFGADPFCSPPVASVSCGRLPGDIRRFSQPLLDETGIGASTPSKFELPLGGAPLTPPSDVGSVTLSSSSGSLDVTISADGTLTLNGNLSEPGFSPLGDMVTITSPLESLSFAVEQTTASGNTSLEVQSTAGLSSTMLVSTVYTDLVTFIYVAPTADPGSPESLKGFVDIQSISDGTSVDGDDRVSMPMISDGLREFMLENNLEPSEDIVVTARNQGSINGIFVIDEDEEITEKPVNGGGGVVVFIPPETIDPPPPGVCTTRPTNVRCTAGPKEVLLSPNNSSDVARYDAITGNFDGFFFGGGPAPNFSIGRGHMATQGPDNCVLYSDSEGDIHIFDTDGSPIPADGEGNLIQTGADSLLTRAKTQATEYTGFDFHSPDDVNWQLYVTARVDSSGNGFGDTAQLIRYDYALDGDAVLANKLVIDEKPGGEFNHVTVLNDRVYLTDDSFNSSTTAQDQIRVFDLEGNELAPLLTDAASPRQLSRTFDGQLVFADFARESIRVVDTGGDTVRNYSVGNGDGTGNDRTRGVYPLRNGDYLITGFSQINRAVLDRFDGTVRLEPDGRSTIGVAVGTACLAAES